MVKRLAQADGLESTLDLSGEKEDIMLLSEQKGAEP